MKKFVYLCGMILLSMNMMAQLDLNDHNWDTVFLDDFTQPGRSWQGWVSHPDHKWMGYPGSGVTENAPHWFEVYQYANSLFCPAEGKMKLVAEYCDTICRNSYPLPGWMHGNYPSCDSLFYFSGEIDVYYNFMRFQYGYFEIRCKLPKHPGAHSGFWIQGASKDSLDPYYEEIDIVEYSWSAGDPGANWLHVINPHATVAGDPRFYSTAITQNERGNINFNTDIYAMIYPHIPYDQEDVSGWHTYSCEWMPDHVYWFLDGNLVNSYYDVMHIPRHPMTLKTDYCINRYALENYYDNGQPEWMGRGVMTIDYINVYQLEWDCETDETITCQSDLDGFDFAVKKNISVTSSVDEPIVSSSDKVTFRVTDSFEITGQFQADSGCEFTVIRQNCPE